MLFLQPTTTSDAEFAIEYSVSTRASSCWKDREPGAGEGSSAGLEGRGASGAGYWGKYPGMSMACWKPFAGAGGEGAEVEGGPQKPRLPLQ